MAAISSINETVTAYIKRGWRPVPIPHCKKKPAVKAWQKLRIDEGTISEHFDRSPMNVGILLGEPSGGVTDIDIDCSEALTLARSGVLPPTDSVFGRKSKPESHFLYHTGLTERIAFMDPNQPEEGGMLVEVRASGQTVFPGSTHESGELIEWAHNGDLAAVDGERLVQAAARLASMSLLMRYWPDKNSHVRHAAAGAVAGFLGRCNESLAVDAPRVVELIARCAGDDEVEDRRRAAEDAVASLADGRKKVPGLPTMREIFGDAVAGKIAEWLGRNDDKLLDKMNAEYFVIDLGGKACVGTFKPDPLGRLVFAPYNFQAFRDLNDNIRVGKGDKSVGLGSWFLKQPKRRQYEGLTFKAGPRGSVADTGKYLNLWRGFGVEPVAGDWSWMSNHIHDVLADGNETHALYMLRWLAWAVQNPTTRAEVMLILKSPEEGTGKGALGNTMTRIFGQHGRRIHSAKHFTGQFNLHLQDASFLYCDEAYWPGNKSEEGAFKGIITEPTLMIEPKRINSYEVSNCIHILTTSNSEWTVPASATARRLAVFRVSNKRMGDTAYFDALFNQMDNGGREAMLFDLLEMDLGNWHPRLDVPKTDELLAEKLNTLDSKMKWFVDLLNSGQLPSYPPLLPNECPTSYLFQDYAKHAGISGERHKGMQTGLGLFLTNLMKKADLRLRKAETSYKENGKVTRGMVYELPLLDECRKAVDLHLGQAIEWDGPDEWLARDEDETGGADDEDIPF